MNDLYKFNVGDRVQVILFEEGGEVGDCGVVTERYVDEYSRPIYAVNFDHRGEWYASEEALEPEGA